jgi:hypothetical protein
MRSSHGFRGNKIILCKSLSRLPSSYMDRSCLHKTPLVLILLGVVLPQLLVPVSAQILVWGDPSKGYLQVFSFDLSGRGRFISASPGETLTGTTSYQIWDNYNPGARWEVAIIYSWNRVCVP